MYNNSFSGTSAMAMPTPIARPFPNDPDVASMPGVFFMQG
jgi:hypothetical protein